MTLFITSLITMILICFAIGWAFYGLLRLMQRRDQ